VFALSAESDWDDLVNAMAASANYQNRLGKILPLFLFAPMTEPQNPDTWEPLKTLPENLLMISIERHIDRRVVHALQQIKRLCGEIHQSGSFPILVQIDDKQPVADVYSQMERSGIRAYARMNGGTDPSFFFLRGADAVKGFAAELPKAPRR
jgi:hypothetical protein